MVAHALEEPPEMRLFSVPGFAAIRESLLHRFFAGFGIVVFMPFLEIGIAHGLRIAGSVIAGGFVFAGLREVGNGVLRDFEDALGALESVDLGRIAAEIEAEIYGHAAVVEKSGVDIRRVSALMEEENCLQTHAVRLRVV